ncbi:MAG: hypothetical protein COZ06_06665 [Armatimonadetes bacterium CG_4_10_14_3_um_filter_66_18]|nr:MAG: hypothetical protein COS65_30220 [Armatimonadetes bacterium CG06_land_8_20_14_3_00_66_21]PIX38713.1 MAG: hypothetical protein COZ57_29885 [Armatimonadetes bacterium CG_4_8_14_3_um_filter_66_20]PIY50960.1 MAG: hypothetical protein COZ06_06665 [Armatimonadetes bacterium CG_4_10_14_3_um_filter_66_18]PJB61362.1 MAG: hypothetical protein CO096_29160 [Armatimonadetes bacterium CG_4_9_14_3_um_filter_66_14]
MGAVSTHPLGALCLALSWCCSAPLPAVAEEAVTAFVGARLEPVSGEPIPSGTVLIEGGKITAAGADVQVPAGARRFDATGKVIMPGLVVPWTRLGLSGVPGGKPAANPEVRVADELYPFQDSYRFALQAGCTTLCLVPGGEGISGQAAVCRPRAETGDDMLLSWWGPLVIDFAATTAGKKAVRDALEGAKKLLRDGKAPPGLNESDDALCRALTGEQRTLVRCGGPGELLHALPFFKDYAEMKITYVGPAHFYRVAEELAKVKAAVLVPAALTYAPETTNRVNAVRELQEAGVEVACYPEADSVSAFRDILLQAAHLVRAGLPRDAALKAVTLGAAEALGFDYRLGSLEPGKDANLLVFNGDPLSPTTRLERVVLEGRTVFEERDEGR